MNRLAIVLGIALLSPSYAAMADWNCACGTVVHSSQPTTCPVCSRPLPNNTVPPPFTPPGVPPYPPTNPNPPVQDGSGLKLGVMIYNAGGRVIVQSVIPNTPAQGRLFPNDQLVKGAFRDAQNGQVFRIPIYSPADLTRLKTMAGAGTPVAMQVFRPTGGRRNFFVSFAADGVVARAYTVQADSAGGQQQPRAAASATITEDTTGQAASMLDGGAPSPGAPVNPGNPNPIPVNPSVPQNPGADTPDSLLNGF